MKQALEFHFKNLSIPVAAENCSWNWKELWIDDIHQLSNSDFDQSNYFIRWWVFDLPGFWMHQNQLIKEEFIFYDNIKQMAEDFIKTSRELFISSSGGVC